MGTPASGLAGLAVGRFGQVRHCCRMRAGIVLLLALLLMPMVRAMEPPRPGELEKLRQEGKLEAAQARARQIGNDRFSPQLATRARQKIARAALKAQGLTEAQIAERLPAPPPAWIGLPTSGSPRTLTVLISFADHTPPAGITQAMVQSNMYGTGTPLAQNFYPVESLNAYYQRASEGVLDLQGYVGPWVQLPLNRAAYEPPSSSGTDENQACFNLLKLALQSAAFAGHDFAQYDNDGDGDIDLVNIIYAGPPGAWSSFWWAYQWSFFINDANTITFGGKRAGDFIFSWVPTRTFGEQTEFSPRVMVHEYGHALGLPDYYDYDGNVGPDGGVGGLDMMDGNWGNHNAFSRWILDWIEPTVVADGAPAVHSLHASGNTAYHTDKAVAVFPSLASEFSQFFIVENRHRIGNDDWPDLPGAEEYSIYPLPADGLLIWHVDATLNPGGTNFLYDNSYTAHKLLRLVQADGLAEIENNGYADAGDYYTAGSVFTPTSTPNSSRYGGIATGVVADSISVGLLATVRVGIDETAIVLPNDDFADATPISGNSNHIESTNDGATKEAGEPSHGGNAGGASVWWQWTAPASGTIVIDTIGSNFDTTLGIYTGSTVDALVTVAGNDDAHDDTYQSRVSFAAASGTTYRIAVDGFDGETGTILLNLAMPPANDLFASAIALAGSSGQAIGTNVGATKEAGEPNHGGDTGGASVWWKWTAPFSGPVALDTHGSDFDTTLGVYTGTAVNALTTIASNDDDPSVDSYQSRVNFTAVSGTTYRIAVDGYDGETGDIVLSLAPPSSDAFATAATISGSSGQAIGTNVGATKEAGEPNHGGDTGGASVWWKWTAPFSGPVTFDTHGSSFDTLLGVYTGTVVNALTTIAGNDDDPGDDSYQSRVNFTAIFGTTYRIAVDGYDGDTGRVVLNWLQTDAITYTVGVHSSPIAGVAISSSSGHGGTTDYTMASVAGGTVVFLEAPADDPSGFTFYNWTIEGFPPQTPGQKSIGFTVNANTVAVAVYLPVITYTLTVQSVPVTGISISSTTGHGGITNYVKPGNVSGSAANLSVPAIDPAPCTFQRWLLNGVAQPLGQRTLDWTMTADTTAIAIYLGDETHTAIYRFRYRQVAYAGATANTSVLGCLALDLQTDRVAAIYGGGTVEWWNEDDVLVLGRARDGTPFPRYLVETQQQSLSGGDAFSFTSLAGRCFGALSIGTSQTAELPALLTGYRYTGDPDDATLLAGRFAARFDQATTTAFNDARMPFDEAVASLQDELTATAPAAARPQPAALSVHPLVYRTRGLLRSAGDGEQSFELVKGYLLAVGQNLVHIVWRSDRDGRSYRIDDWASEAIVTAYVADGGAANVQVYAIQPPALPVSEGDLVRLLILNGRTVPDTLIGTTRRDAVAPRLTGRWHLTGNSVDSGDYANTTGSWTATLDTAWTTVANDSNLDLSALRAAIIADLEARGYLHLD